MLNIITCPKCGKNMTDVCSACGYSIPQEKAKNNVAVSSESEGIGGLSVTPDLVVFGNGVGSQNLRVNNASGTVIVEEQTDVSEWATVTGSGSFFNISVEATTLDTARTGKIVFKDCNSGNSTTVTIKQCGNKPYSEETATVSEMVQMEDERTPVVSENEERREKAGTFFYVFYVIVGVVLMGILIGKRFVTHISSTQECEHDYEAVVTRVATYDVEGQKTYTCKKCGSSYAEIIPKLIRQRISKNVMDDAFTQCKYKSGPFTIKLDVLLYKAMSNYQIVYYTGEEAIAKGYISEKQFGADTDINNLYFAVVSGDTMVNPDIKYMTQYEKEAAKVYFIFDDSNNLKKYGIHLCDNLETCAILLMSSGY